MLDPYLVSLINAQSRIASDERQKEQELRLAKERMLRDWFQHRFDKEQEGRNLDRVLQGKRSEEDLKAGVEQAKLGLQREVLHAQQEAAAEPQTPHAMKYGRRPGGMMELFDPRRGQYSPQSMRSNQYSPMGAVEPGLQALQQRVREDRQAQHDAAELALAEQAISAGLAEYTPQQQWRRSQLQTAADALMRDATIRQGQKDEGLRRIRDEILGIDRNPLRRSPGSRPKDTAAQVQGRVFWDGGSWGQGTPWVVDPETGQPQIPRGWQKPEKLDPVAAWKPQFEAWKAVHDARTEYIKSLSGVRDAAGNPMYTPSSIQKQADAIFGPVSSPPSLTAVQQSLSDAGMPQPGGGAGPFGQSGVAVVDTFGQSAGVPTVSAGLGVTPEMVAQRGAVQEMLRQAAAETDPTKRGARLKLAGLIAKGEKNWDDDDRGMFDAAKEALGLTTFAFGPGAKPPAAPGDAATVRWAQDVVAKAAANPNSLRDPVVKSAYDNAVNILKNRGMAVDAPLRSELRLTPEAFENDLRGKLGGMPVHFLKQVAESSGVPLEKLLQLYAEREAKYKDVPLEKTLREQFGDSAVDMVKRLVEENGVSLEQLMGALQQSATDKASGIPQSSGAGATGAWGAPTAPPPAGSAGGGGGVSGGAGAVGGWGSGPNARPLLDVPADAVSTAAARMANLAAAQGKQDVVQAISTLMSLRAKYKNDDMNPTELSEQDRSTYYAAKALLEAWQSGEK